MRNRREHQPKKGRNGYNKIQIQQRLETSFWTRVSADLALLTPLSPKTYRHLFGKTLRDLKTMRRVYKHQQHISRRVLTHLWNTLYKERWNDYGPGTITCATSETVSFLLFRKRNTRLMKNSGTECKVFWRMAKLSIIGCCVLVTSTRVPAISLCSSDSNIW